MFTFTTDYTDLEAVLNLSCDDLTGAKRTKKSPKAHTETDTSSQEKLFGEIQNSFLIFKIIN